MKIFQNKSLKNLTALKIGGIVNKFYILENIYELQEFFKSISEQEKLKIKILGSGTNILVSDDTNLDLVVLKLDGEFSAIRVNELEINAGAGALLSKVLKDIFQAGYEGLEVLAGIPGTVGGAISGNAGSKYGCIWNFIKFITVADYDGNIKYLEKKDIVFRYRNVDFNNQYVILNVEFDRDKFIVCKSFPKQLDEKYRAILNEKMQTQPYGFRSAGCVFKNTDSFSAGKLLDEIGLKGKRIGQVYISDKHANFFIADKGANFKDFISLIDLAKNKIKSEKNLNLELEIKIWR